MLYRRRFEHRTRPIDGRAFSSSTASSTTATCGSTANTSARPKDRSSAHAFEVTDALRDRADHLLAVEVGVARRKPTAAPSARSPAATGSSPMLDPDAQSGRHLAPVRIVESRAGAHRERARACAVKRRSSAGACDCHVVLDTGASRASTHGSTRVSAGPPTSCCSTPVARRHARGRRERARVDTRPSRIRRAGGRTASGRSHCARST